MCRSSKVRRGSLGAGVLDSHSIILVQVRLSILHIRYAKSSSEVRPSENPCGSPKSLYPARVHPSTLLHCIWSMTPEDLRSFLTSYNYLCPAGCPLWPCRDQWKRPTDPMQWLTIGSSFLCAAGRTALKQKCEGFDCSPRSLYSSATF